MNASFRIEPDQRECEEIRRVAVEQLTEARRLVTKLESDRARSIHLLRRCFKRLRALLRLARPIMPNTYRIENKILRDQARRISAIRDVDSLAETFASIEKKLAVKIPDKQLDAIRSMFSRPDSRVDTTELQASLLDQIQSTIDRSTNWKPEHVEKSVIDGFEKTYRQSRRSMRKAAKSRATPHLHEWRKHVKYHWHQCQLLSEFNEDVMDSRLRPAKKIASRLGDDHDLALFIEAITTQPGKSSLRKAGVSRKTLRKTVKLCRKRRDRLETAALRKGKRLFRKSSILR
ncbi:CHAD domain protein [Thalassoglobus neptunius]|uniref:CHAD domain protein n=1 Tax=Thalassoglobus neptunius TaxID=1938619 RepID=A0A5C5X1L1_9PLAN|nr:CHAD domain-containing protein [Thalassoglobus neptunius]TWT56690.1 CHAD domain protein [Thalassoglobus neptunius]